MHVQKLSVYVYPYTPATTTTTTTQDADARWRDNTFRIECDIKYNYKHERFVCRPFWTSTFTQPGIRFCCRVFNSRAEIFAFQSRRRPVLFIQGHSILNRQLGSITWSCFLFDIRPITLKYTPCNTLQKKVCRTAPDLVPPMQTNWMGLDNNYLCT